MQPVNSQVQQLDLGRGDDFALGEAENHFPPWAQLTVPGWPHYPQAESPVVLLLHQDGALDRGALSAQITVCTCLPM